MKTKGTFFNKLVGAYNAREVFVPSQEGAMEAMWFYDDADDLEELQTFRKQAQELEQKHLEIRVALCDAEAALRGNPGNTDLNRHYS